MTDKKFFAVLMLLLVLTIGGSGCGSSSSGTSESTVPPTSEDVTPKTYYTVTFESNGGSEVSEIKVESGKTITAPTDPTREGYIFGGWYKDEALTQAFSFSETITSDLKLYAGWTEAGDAIVQYAASEIVIGYQGADNPKYVTQNLTLPTKIDSADISWTSNSGAIDGNGTVKRQASDTDVTLTATASYNGRSYSRTFNLKVIKKRTRVNSEIIPLTADEAKSGDIEVTRNASGDVTDIEGVYVSFDISNADDALDAVTVIRNELGVKNPADELELNGVTVNDFGGKYCFGQIYNGLPVYGRRIIVSAKSDNKANFLISDFISPDILDSASLSSGYSKSQAEDVVKSDYSEVNDCNSAEVIYSFGDYENSPVRAWIVAIFGTKNDGSTESENVIVRASDGTIITRTSNFHYARGTDEFNDDVEFPVITTQIGNDEKAYQYMADYDLGLIIAGSLLDVYTGNPCVNARAELNENWNDPQQVSAYINMREILTWWKNVMGRESLYGNDSPVYVFTHTPWAKDNAMFTSLPFEGIYVFDNKKYTCSFAACRDFMAHETTHAVMYHEASCMLAKIGYSPSTQIPLYIDEAYADIFACLFTDDWKIGRDLFADKTSLDCNRNIEEPYDQKSEFGNAGLTENWWNKAIELHGEQGSLEYLKWDAHLVSVFISHAAYLMGQKGLSSSELRNLWYATIYKGAYNSGSKDKFGN